LLKKLRPRYKRKKKKNHLKLIIPGIFMLAVLWVWKSIETDRLSRVLTSQERAKKVMIEKNKQLQAELEKYRSIAWVDSCVRQKYGMTYNVKQRIVLYDLPVAHPAISRSFLAGLGDLLERTARTIIGEQ
jgi:hypothetical protein